MPVGATPGGSAGGHCTGGGVGREHGGAWMNSEQLYYFELTYLEKSYSAAARRVPVSHQGLTKSIRSLERELGVTLFVGDAETGKPIPTAYAHELYDFVQAYNNNVRLLQQSFQRLKGSERHEIRLGASLGTIPAFGSHFLDDFHKAYPNAHVSYWESNDALCEEGLQEERFDLALCVMPLTPGCTGRVLYRSPFFMWARRDDPMTRRALAGSGKLRLDDLSGRVIAIPGTGFKCYEQLKRVTAEHGIEIGRIIEMSEIFQIYSFALSGDGLGFSNGTLVDHPAFTGDDSVVALPIEGLTWGFAIERLASHALTDGEKAFCDWCVIASCALPRNDVTIDERRHERCGEEHAG